MTAPLASADAGSNLTGLSAPARGASAGWRQAWQQAQAAGWFCRADALGAGRQEAVAQGAFLSQRGAGARAGFPAAQAAAAGAPAVGMGPAHPMSPSALRNVSCVPQAPSMQGEQSVAPGPARAREVGPPALAVPLTTRLQRGDGEPAAAASPAAEPRATQPRPAFHIHLEREGDAVHAWLGLAAGTPADMAVATLQQQLAHAGLRLASLTCNGARLFEASKER